MQPLANILIVADKDKIYGVEKGYYKSPSLKNSLNNGNLLLVSYEEWRNSLFKLKTPPLCNGEDVYIWNPYSNSFISTSDNDLLYTFCMDKCQVIKEALVWMGAKHIILKEEVKDEDQLNAALAVCGHKGPAGGSINTKYSRISSLDINQAIVADDPERTPKSIEKVEQFLNTHGLANDTGLKLFADRLREDGKLTGHEKYTATYLSEVQVAFDILAKVDYNKVFSASLDFSLEHKHLHAFSKELDVTF